MCFCEEKRDRRRGERRGRTGHESLRGFCPWSDLAPPSFLLLILKPPHPPIPSSLHHPHPSSPLLLTYTHPPPSPHIPHAPNPHPLPLSQPHSHPAPPLTHIYTPTPIPTHSSCPQSIPPPIITTPFTSCTLSLSPTSLYIFHSISSPSPPYNSLPTFANLSYQQTSLDEG